MKYNAMREVADMSDIMLISKELFAIYTDNVITTVSKIAIEEYRIEKSKNEKLTISEIAKQEKCTPPTVIEWINKGLKKGKIKLNASKKGSKNYVVSRFDLNQFLEEKTNYNN